MLCSSLRAPHTGVGSTCTNPSYTLRMCTPSGINISLEVYLDLNQGALGCLQTTTAGDILEHAPCAELLWFRTDRSVPENR